MPALEAASGIRKGSGKTAAEAETGAAVVHHPNARQTQCLRQGGKELIRQTESCYSNDMLRFKQARKYVLPLLLSHSLSRSLYLPLYLLRAVITFCQTIEMKIVY